LGSMFLSRWLKVGSVLLAVAATASGVNLIAPSEGPGAQARAGSNPPDSRVGDATLHEIRPGKLVVKVNERGSLETARSWDSYCKIEGTTSIIWLLPEGTRVRKEQLVCELDSAPLRDRLANQLGATKSAERGVRKAELARGAAEITVAEYEGGTSQREEK